MVPVVALTLLAPSAAWYVDDRCVTVANLVYSARIDEAKVQIAELSASKDLDDQACALWVTATMKEMELALLDDQEHLWAEMHDDLDALERFGRAHADTLRFKDLIIEAEFRRVRVFAEQSEKTSAVLAARRAQALLDARRRIKHASPSFFYAEAVMNLAVTHADWHIRAALTLVGMKGNGDRGKKAMKILLSRPSVYRSEAMVVARSFTLRVPGLFDAPLVYSSELRDTHPTNPQLAFDYATDLSRVGRCDEALQSLPGSVDKYSKVIQAKIASARDACQ